MQGALAIAAYVVPTLFGLGVYLSTRSRPSRVEAAAVSWGVGWAAVNLLSFTANQFLSIALDRRFYLIVSLALGAVGTALVVWRRSRLRSLFQMPIFPPELRSRIGLASLGLLGIFLAFVFYKALITWPAAADELVYHVEIPKLAWQTGTLPLLAGIDPVSMGTVYPDLLVTQQLWVYLGAGVFDPVLVRPVMPVYTSLLLLLVFFDCRRWFGLFPALLAGCLLFSINSFASLTTILFDEIPVAFYAYIAWRWVASSFGGNSLPVGAAVFAGFAALVKYDGLAAAASLGLAVLSSPLWRRGLATAQAKGEQWRLAGRNGIVFLGVAVLVALPLLLRNFVRLGNPVYPFFFGGANTVETALVYLDITPEALVAIRGFELVSILATVVVAAVLMGVVRVRELGLLERFALVFAALYLPPFVYYPLPSSQIRYLAPVLPAISIFGGRQLAWWLLESRRKRRAAGAAVLVALISVAVGMVLLWKFQTTYIQGTALGIAEVFVVSAAMLVAIAGAATLLRSNSGRSSIALAAALVLVTPGFFAVVAEQWEPRQNVWQPDLLPRNRDDYLADRLGDDWLMWQWMNANLLRDGSVLTFEPRLLYLDVPILFAGSREVQPSYNMSFAAAIKYVQILGARYVLDSPFGDNIFINLMFWKRSVIFQNLGNRSAFVPLRTQGQVVLYQIIATM